MPNGAKALFRRIFAQRQVRTTAPVETATVAAPARRGIRLAMLAIETFYTPARVNTVDQLLDYVRQADARFAAEDNPFNDQELRIFLAPEWYFRKVGTPYTHAEMRAIVEELRVKTAAAEFRNWIIVAGTIYFGLGFDGRVDHADDLTVNTAEARRVRDEIRQYFVLTNGAVADASPTRAEPALPVQWFVGNVALVFRQGRLLHHRFKIYEHDIADDKKTSGQEKWAMFTLPLAARRLLAQSALFSTDNLKFAIDVCRDHIMYAGVWSFADAKSRLPGPAQANEVGVDFHIIIANDVGPKVTDGCVSRDGGYFIECDGKGDNITTAVKIGRDTPPTDDPALIDNLLAAEEAVRPHVDPLADAQGLVSNLLGPLNSAKEQRAPLIDAIHEQTKKISKMSAGPKRTEEERVLRLRKEALQVFDADILLPRQQAYDNASRAMQATRTTFDTAKTIETGHRQALSTANRSRAAASELGTATASPLKTWSGKMYLDDEDA